MKCDISQGSVDLAVRLGREHTSPAINLASGLAFCRRSLFRFRPNSTNFTESSVANEHTAGLRDAPSYVESKRPVGYGCQFINKCVPERASVGGVKPSARRAHLVAKYSRLRCRGHGKASAMHDPSPALNL